MMIFMNLCIVVYEVIGLCNLSHRRSIFCSYEMNHVALTEMEFGKLLLFHIRFKLS